MSFIIDLLLINIIVAIIVDMTDFPSTAKKALSYLLTKGLIVTDKYNFHLFSCSLCITWWLSLIYTICIGMFSLKAISLCILSALFVSVTSDILFLMKDIIIKMIVLVRRLFKI